MCAASFDHLVGAQQKSRRYIEVDRLGGLEVEDRLELRRLLDWQVAGFSAFENFVHVSGSATKHVRKVYGIGYQAAGYRELAESDRRLIAQWLSERLGQQFIIENRPGAGANIALQAAANSPPDGYTLVTITSSNASNATLYESLPFNLQRDLIPIAALSRGALV